MAHALESAYSKLARATEHLAQLDTEASAFVNSQPYKAIPKWDFDAPEHTMRVRTVVNPPVHLGLLAADALHNIRCSLDHLVYQLAGIGGESKRGEWTQWPICDTPKFFESKQGVYLKGVDHRHRALIKDAQPFNPRFRLFSKLALLDDRDKHRIIQPIASTAVSATMRAEPPDAIHDLRLPTDVVYLDDETVLCWFRAEKHVPVKYELAYTLRFGSRGGPQIDMGELRMLVVLASDVLSVFIEAFD